MPISPTNGVLQNTVEIDNAASYRQFTISGGAYANGPWRLHFKDSDTISNVGVTILLVGY